MVSPLNTCCEEIWHELLHTRDIPLSPTPKSNMMGPGSSRWCKFRKVKGHHTTDCYQLKKEIECNIQEGLEEICQKRFHPNSRRIQLSRGNVFGRLRPKNGKESSEGGEDRPVRHTLNVTF